MADDNEDRTARLAELQQVHDEKAEAIGVFEAEWAAVEAEWQERRRTVNDAYKAADAALEQERVAQADPNRPAPQAIAPHIPDDGGDA